MERADGGVINQLTSLRLFQPLRQSALRRIASSPSGEPLTPSVSPTARQLPLRGSLLACANSVPQKPPCRGRWLRVQRADGGSQPALKGEVDASGTSRRRGYKSAHISPFVSTPQTIRLTAYCQLPVRGAFNSLSQTFSLPAPSVREPFGALHTLPRSPAFGGFHTPLGVFHIASAIFHCA